MENEENEMKVKICRHCHVHFDSMEQKFCGNGCQKKEPFSSSGISGKDFEPRVVKVRKNEEYTDGEGVRWICNFCHDDFSDSILKDKDYICPSCGKENDFYPFTEKKCANCKEDDKTHRKLPIWAKACEKCGKKDFIINNNKNINDLITIYTEETQESWEGPTEIFEMDPEVKVKRETKNLISCTFTILNSNLKYVLFAEGKSITLLDLINDGMGYIPDRIYHEIFIKFTEKKPLFEIQFKNKKNNEKFFFKSVFPFEMRKLNARYFPEGETRSIKANSFVELPENELYLAEINLMNTLTLKLHFWVY